MEGQHITITFRVNEWETFKEDYLIAAEAGGVENTERQATIRGAEAGSRECLKAMLIEFISEYLNYESAGLEYLG